MGIGLFRQKKLWAGLGSGRWLDSVQVQSLVWGHRPVVDRVSTTSITQRRTAQAADDKGRSEDWYTA